MDTNQLIIVRGGGDMATAVIHKLWRAGFRVLVLETDAPAAIRRQVAVSEAVYDGKAAVEGMTAVRIDALSEMEAVWAQQAVPLYVDPQGACIAVLKPIVVVDAMIAKRNMGTHMAMAPLTVALGPGFVAGEDVHAVIETMRGHNLGRIMMRGAAQPNTGVPGRIGGYAAERVIHADHAGVIRHVRAIGDYVNRGETIAVIKNDEGEFSVTASIPGLIRGLIREGFVVTRGFKIADIDPRREEYENCFTISDKARCIAGTVLELVCVQVMKTEKEQP
ncbi:MAG: EF2563 family selenium-dependent molybdenum hydroxylase system protein [Clostridiales bacterium]|nr:EF2563 family selenium-dependent molybdenum hydroxylase system protein [Clostridiales bacterium]